MNITESYEFESGYWYAVDQDSYDGAPDGNNVIGMGRTKDEAIENLKDMLVQRIEMGLMTALKNKQKQSIYRLTGVKL
jgi:hypothetical protein